MNLDLVLREPGRLVLIERRALLARLAMPLSDRLSQRDGARSAGVFANVAKLLRLARRDDEAGDDVAGGTQKLALPFIPWAAEAEPADDYLLYREIAIIDVCGILTRRGYYDWWEYGWVGGYEGLGAAIARARADSRVKAIFLRIESPGGLSDGCFELCDDIIAGSARKGGKPIWAHCHVACSAAYAIAAACDRIWSVAEGEVGSIGVYMLHMDATEWLKSEGLKVEAIESGAHKTDGQFWKPLDDNARASFQAVVDQVARRFAATVSAGRGLTAEAVIAQEARWYLARHDEAERSGLALGLVDDIATEPAAFAALQVSLSNETGAGAPAAAGDDAASNAARAESTMEMDMSLKEQIAALRTKAAAGDAAAIADLKAMGVALKAEAEGDDKDKKKDAKTEGGEDGEGDDEEDDDGKEPAAKATGSRAGFALLSCKEARGRDELAKKLAAKVAAGKLGYGEAKDMLAAAPKASRLADAMAGRDQNPGSPDGGGNAGAGLAAAVDRVIAKTPGARRQA
jgi:signal peptide peptidase SppA